MEAANKQLKVPLSPSFFTPHTGGWGEEEEEKAREKRGNTWERTGSF
jgi:hypothetical protein